MSLLKKLKSLFPPPRPKPPEMPPGYTLIVRRPGEFSFITNDGKPWGDEGDLNDISFTLLPTMAEGNPKIAKALLILGEVINGNREQLIIEASK